MADYTAIVEAGEALVEMLRDHLAPEPISNRELISLCSPHESENNQLTVYLYQLEEDPHNTQGGYYQYTKDIQKIRPAKFHLNFLVTAHSKAPSQLKEADQHRMIGAVVQIIMDNPVLDKKYLSGSILESNETLRVSVERPNFDQLIKIWNNTAAPYKLSIAVRLDGVEIESKRMRTISRVVDATISVDEKPS